MNSGTWVKIMSNWFLKMSAITNQFCVEWLFKEPDHINKFVDINKNFNNVNMKSILKNYINHNILMLYVGNVQASASGTTFSVWYILMNENWIK